MAYPTNNLRIRSSRVVIPPIFLEEEMPLTDNASRTVFEARRHIVDILNKADAAVVCRSPVSIRRLQQINGPGLRGVEPNDKDGVLVTQLSGNGHG